MTTTRRRRPTAARQIQRNLYFAQRAFGDVDAAQRGRLGRRLVRRALWRAVWRMTR